MLEVSEVEVEVVSILQPGCDSVSAARSVSQGGQREARSE